MGSGRFDATDWSAYSTAKSYDKKTADEVINRTKVEDDMLPTNFKNGLRESRDSADNPRSTPIIVAGDVTGSMGRLAGTLIKDGLASLATAVYDRKPVSDPHIMGMAVGDLSCDRVPIQCTQFEADIRIIDQFGKLFVESGGGGNNSEGYHGPWFVAAQMTRHDAWEKRGEKGILFTYGDECPPTREPITPDQAKRFFGIDIQANISAQDALDMVRRTYDVYHLLIEESGHYQYAGATVRAEWTDLLGQHVIPVSDHTKLAEVMVSILQISRGDVTKDAVTKSWSGDTSMVVARAIDGVAVATRGSAAGLVAL